MAHPAESCRGKEETAAKAALARSGYARGGRLRQEEGADDLKDKRMIKKAVGQHERHDHPGKPKTDIKLRRGGHVKGDRPEHRADKRARGGRMEGEPMEKSAMGSGAPKGKGGHTGAKVNVNIISPAAAEGEKKQAAMAGMQAGAHMAAAQMAGGKPMGGPPPMAPPGAGGPPGAAMPPRPMGPPPGQPPMKRGGRLK